MGWFFSADVCVCVYSPASASPRALSENVEQLQEDLDAVGCADESVQQRAREERQRVDDLRKELEKLTAQESRLPPDIEKLSAQLSQGRTLVAQREAGCEASMSSKQQKLAELDKGCALYRQRLGLTFERVGDERLRLTFVNIDATNPMKPYAFQVFVDGGDKYHVISVPHAPRLRRPCARHRGRSRDEAPLPLSLALRALFVR